MKAAAVLSLLAACHCISLSGEEPAGLEVHEWGTFTVISGSDGLPLRWYQPEQTLSELPDFIESTLPRGRNGTQVFFGKSGPASLVRMETPVLYFYPDKAMSVQVDVQFPQGRLTEWYPPPVSVVSPSSMSTVWKGELRRPDDKAASATMPVVTGSKGAHYGHAREVPDAWFFQSSRKANAVNPQGAALPAQGKGQANHAEKFIFYRGAGDAVPPMNAFISDDRTFTLRAYDSTKLPFKAFALSVSAEGARWETLTSGQDSGPRTVLQAKPSAKTSIPELAAEMTTSLVAAGLTTAEAKAMVATWSDLWFAEKGDRILVLVPRSWVDEVLPLQVTPLPEKLTRVFVARMELFSPAREKMLLGLLDKLNRQEGGPTVEDVKEFRELELGRFAEGASVRAQTMLTNRAVQSFRALGRAAGDAGRAVPSTAAR